MASLAVHALVLAGGGWTAAPSLQMPLATIRLVVSPGLASPPAAQKIASVHAPVPAEKHEAAVQPATKLPSAAAAKSPPATVGDEGRTPAARETPAAVSGEVAAPGASANSAPHEGLRADALREYRLALAIEARRYKRYPPLARERGWEGTVEAAVSGGSVAAPLVSLERSSGYAALDEQTIDMLRRAALSTPLPEGLRGREFRVVVPVRFSLENER
jgi:protein TonB